MPRTQNRAVMNWIVAFGSFAVLLVVYGGFVRLTRSGLSIVEWNPVMGAVPPLTQTAWQAEFARYQLSPEYRQINFDMTLAQYKEIYLIEWFHRILARLAGLIFAIPFVIFVIRGQIPWKELGVYLVMGVLFLAQAVMGWIMVSSGLVDRPSVSHFLLTAHLFLALILIGFSVWTALGHKYGFPDTAVPAKWSTASKVTLTGLILLLIQIAYGGFTAGLKAGHVSDTWPTMLGRWIPGGMLSQIQPALSNLVSAPLTVVFIHRWFAFIVLIAAAIVYWIVREGAGGTALVNALGLLVGLTVLQIALGIAVVLTRVQIEIAMLHQLNAIGLFAVTVYLLNRLRTRDYLRVTHPRASIAS
jgi:heme a synthase